MLIVNPKITFIGNEGEASSLLFILQQQHTIMTRELFEPSTWAEVEDAEQSAKHRDEHRSTLCTSILSFTSSPEKHPLTPIDPPPPSLHASLSAPQAYAAFGRSAAEFEETNFLDSRAASLPRGRLIGGDVHGRGRGNGGGEEVVNPKHFEDLLGMGRVDLETEVLVRRYRRGRRQKGERRWLRGKGVGVGGVGGLVNPASEDFDAENYLARVHGGTAVKDLIDGLESLKNVEDLVQNERDEVLRGIRGRVLLVAEDFENTMSDRKGLLKFRVDVKQVMTEYVDIWRQVLEKRTKLDRLKRVREIVRMRRAIFQLPEQILAHVDSIEHEEDDHDEDGHCPGLENGVNTGKTVSAMSINDMGLLVEEKDEDKKLIGTITIRKLSSMLNLYSSAEFFLACQTHTTTLRPFEKVLRNSMARLISALQSRLQHPTASKTQLMNVLSILLTICPEKRGDKKNRRSGNNKTSEFCPKQSLSGVSLDLVERALYQRLTNSLQMMQTQFLPRESLLPLSQSHVLTVLSSASSALASAYDHYSSLSSAVLSLPATREVRKKRRIVIATHLSNLLELFDKLNPLPLPQSSPLPSLKHLSQLFEVTGLFCHRKRRLGPEVKLEGLTELVEHVQDLTIRFLEDVRSNVRTMCRNIGRECRIGASERALGRIRCMVDEVEVEVRKRVEGLIGNEEGNKRIEEGLRELRRNFEIGMMEAADALFRRGSGLEEKLAIVGIMKKLRNELVGKAEEEDQEWERKKEVRFEYLCDKALEEAVAIKVMQSRDLLVNGLRDPREADSKIVGVREYVREVVVMLGMSLAQVYGKKDKTLERTKSMDIIVRLVGNDVWRTVVGLEWESFKESQVGQLWVDVKGLEGAFGGVDDDLQDVTRAVRKVEAEMMKRGIAKARRERWETIAIEEMKKMDLVRQCVEGCRSGKLGQEHEAFISPSSNTMYQSSTH